MTKEEFAQKMRKIQTELEDDNEAAHVNADELLCECLESLGYIEGVKIFKELGKWYS